MANVVIDIAAEYTGNKAFKQAETATAKLEKSVGKLGKQLLGVFAVSKIVSFGKASVKAFAADEKAARSLSLALANTGNAFASIQVEGFIADLQRTTGVLDDELRPAFRTLITATGDVKKSQDGLTLALDIAAGTTADLGTVSKALAKAYGGQTTALSRLVPGLNKAILKTGDMDQITQELTNRFKGQALAAAEGYAGQMDRLAVATNNAKEIIGKDLLDSLALVSGPGGITKTTAQIEDLATAIGDTVYGLAVLIDKLNNFKLGGAIFGTFADILSNLQPFAALRKLGSSSRPTPAQSPGERKKIDKINADAVAIQKRLNALNKIDGDNTARKITLTGDQLALQELTKKFDVERIGLFTALNNATDQETQMRIKSLIAIKDNDTALAGKIKAETDAANSAIRLAAMFDRLTVSSSTFYTPQALATAASNQAYMAEQLAPYYGNQPSPSSTFYTPKALELQNQFSASSNGMYQPSSITVNVQGSVTTERDLVSVITQGIYNNQASGIPINYSTAY
jgi:hypothetical protein